MIESPIETARRVWPGEWTELISGTRVPSLALPTVRAKAFWFRVVVGWHHPRWTVTCNMPFGGCTIAQGNENGDDLEAVLTEARDIAQGAVADVACAVGLNRRHAAETPLEMAQRVWPGPWRAAKLGFHRAPGLRMEIDSIVVQAYICAPQEWVVETSLTGRYDTIARGTDLASVLPQARDALRADAAAIARAVGLEIAKR